MKTDDLLDEFLPDRDLRRTRQQVVAAEPARVYEMVVDDEAFREPLPGVPGQITEPWPLRRYRGAVGDLPSTVLREEPGRGLVIGSVGRRRGPSICWRPATPGAVRTLDEPGHCRAVAATVTREHDEGTLVAHQARLVWTDDGPPEPVEETMKLALANGMRRRLEELAARAED